jgi:hypothetical protein
MEHCVLCGELLLADNRPCGGGRADRICLLRSAVGGIGHLIDHDYWCLQRGDPDAGQGYRASALAVQLWIDQHGLDAAVTGRPGSAVTREH